MVNDEYSDENSSLVQSMLMTISCISCCIICTCIGKSMCSGQGSGATRNAGGIIDNLSDKVQSNLLLVRSKLAHLI